MLPNLIVMDGPSGAGKTTVAKEIQEALLPSIWLNISIDSMVYGLPESVLERCNTKNDWEGVDNNLLFSGALAAVDAVVSSGGSVIFDVVVSNANRAEQIRQAFLTHKTFYIGVCCSWEEIEARTLIRGDRTREEARYGFENSPQHFEYDFCIDTTGASPSVIAKECLEHINSIE